MLMWYRKTLDLRTLPVICTPPLRAVWRIEVQVLQRLITDLHRLARLALYFLGTNGLRTDDEAINSDRDCFSVYVAGAMPIIGLHIRSHDWATSVSLRCRPADVPANGGRCLG